MNDITELVFILDMSGSMDPLTDDTIGGFNSVPQEQAEKEGTVLVTTYLFNNVSRRIHDRLPVAEVPAMTRQDYRAGGCTALMDAVGGAIRHIAGIHRYARKEDVPGRTLFVIITDGMENASRRYRAQQVRDMIEHEKEKYGWDFLFLASNIDAADTGARFSVDPELCVDLMPDKDGSAMAYRTVNNAVGRVRERCALASDRQWREDADEDFRKRKK